MPGFILMLFLFSHADPCLAQNPKNLITPDTTVKDTSGQRDLIDIARNVFHIHFKKVKHVHGRKVYYSFIPISTAVPGGGNALVTATTAGFYIGDRKQTYLSSVTFSPSINLHGQYNIPFHTNIWLNGNTWNFQGDMRYSYYPLYTWGLGGSQPENDKILLRYKYVRFYQNALKRIRPFLMAGLGYQMDYNIGIHTALDSPNLKQFSGYANGTANNSNSFSSGLTFTLLYDTRNNSINPYPGWYGNLVYRINQQWLGSDQNWSSLYLDVRKYIPLSKKGQNVLAFWTFLWTTMGSNAPYLDLPSIGGDAFQKSGRGFYSARYVGKSLYDLEAEYRKDITADGLLGFVLFANVNSVTEPHTSQFRYWHPGGGGGLRVKFNKRSATNISMDVGFSKGYASFGMGLGETF